MTTKKMATMVVSEEEHEEVDILEPERAGDSGLAAVIDRVLDKGLVINADIAVNVNNVELLGITIRAALSSFETAAQYGLQFPAGTNIETAAWKEAMTEKEECPQCYKRVPTEQLLSEKCPWCGWMSAKARSVIAERVSV